MLNITKQSDYGILFISSLVGKKEYTSLSKLVNETKLPQRFLARIASELVKHKIVDSREGKVGGYKLNKKVNTLTLYSFLKIFEGELSLSKCTEPNYKCPWEYMCKHRSFLRHTLNSIVTKELKQWKLVDLFQK